MAGIGKTTTTVTPTSDQIIDGVIYGIKWYGPISYAFPEMVSDYSYTLETSQNFAKVTTGQQTAALFALEQSDANAANDGFSVEGFTAIDIAAGDAKTAHIRFGQSDAPPTAYAYMPGTYNQAGDLWFGRNYDYTNPLAGNYAWHTILHEIGHALGLKHGHETQNGFAALPTEYDSLEYSIMTYRSYVGDDTGPYSYSTWSAPQTYMMADIAALQTLYGADFTTNSGDTIYKWTPGSGDTLVNGEVAIDAGGSAIFATIWDGGGDDTYDLSSYSTSLTIDITPGSQSVFHPSQLAYLGSGHSASGSIYNALLHNGDLRSIIENVRGGSAADVITGNSVANVLFGNSGADTLRGNSGNDTLRGNSGNDKIHGDAGNDIMFGGNGTDKFFFEFAFGSDVIKDFSNGTDLIVFDDSVFTSFSQVYAAASNSSGNLIIDVPSSTDQILIEGFVKANLNSADIMFI